MSGEVPSSWAVHMELRPSVGNLLSVGIEMTSCAVVVVIVGTGEDRLCEYCPCVSSISARQV